MRIYGSLDAYDVHLFLLRLVPSARTSGTSPTVGVAGVGACNAGNNNAVKLETAARNPRLMRLTWRCPALAPRRGVYCDYPLRTCRLLHRDRRLTYGAGATATLRTITWNAVPFSTTRFLEWIDLIEWI